MEQENVQVVLRLRPLSDKERRQGEENVWRVYEGASVVLRREIEDNLPIRKFTQSQSAFNFDRCFTTSATNELVYEATIKGMVDSAVNGVNGTVFMYGQTGSGKTFTMLGYDQKKGIYNKALADEANSRSKSQKKKSGPDLTFEMRQKQHLISEELIEDTQLQNKTGLLIQALKDLFRKIKTSEEKTFFIKCSYVEIYNDQIYDLLQRHENMGETLMVCEDTAKDEFFIRGVREEAIDDWTDAIDKLKRGEINRHYARTVMNHSSSRSHTIFRVYIQSLVSSWNGKGGSPAYVTESWFNFVDLAGSEKVSNHDQIEEGNKLQLRVKEGKHINKSLFFLTQVIKLKSEGKKTHIPFRNSPLTKILRSSLGGNSRTAIVLCVNPTYSHLEQTFSTIRFGLSAKKIQNRISANVITRDDDEAVRIMIADYEKKLRDNERDREYLREREKKLMQKILNLEKKNIDTAKNLKHTQQMKFTDVAGNLEERVFENVLLDYDRQGHTYMDDAGILMLTGNNTRYKAFNKVVHKNIIDQLRLEDKAFLDYDYKCLKYAYHNPSGEYAVQCLKNVKQTMDTDLKLYKEIKKNWQTMRVAEYLKEIQEELGGISKKNIARVDQLLEMYSEVHQSQKKTNKELDKYEGRAGVSEVNDEELEKYLKSATEMLHRCVAEKNRREMMKRIAQSSGLTEDQLKLVASLSKDPNTISEESEPNHESQAQEANPELAEDEDLEHTNYINSIREDILQDSTAMSSLPEILSEEQLNKALFQNCDEIMQTRFKNSQQAEDYYEDYKQKVESTHQQILEQSKNQECMKCKWVTTCVELDHKDSLENKSEDKDERDDTSSISVSVTRTNNNKQVNEYSENEQITDNEESKTPRIGRQEDYEDEEEAHYRETEENEEDATERDSNPDQDRYSVSHKPEKFGTPSSYNLRNSHAKEGSKHLLQNADYSDEENSKHASAYASSRAYTSHNTPVTSYSAMQIPIHKKSNYSTIDHKPTVGDSRLSSSSSQTKPYVSNYSQRELRNHTPSRSKSRGAFHKNSSSMVLSHSEIKPREENSSHPSPRIKQQQPSNTGSGENSLAEILRQRAGELKEKQRRSRASRSGRKPDEDY